MRRETVNRRNVRKKATRRSDRRSYLSIRTIILIFTLLFLLGGVLLGSSWSDAKRTKAANERPIYKYYTSIQIEKDDTLWSIAECYGNEEYQSKSEYITEVKQLNQIDEDQIHSGQHLLIPYYSEKTL